MPSYEQHNLCSRTRRQESRSQSIGNTGKKIAKFSIAVKEYSPNTDVPQTIWLDVDAWEGLAERVAKPSRKGREVVLNGRLSTSTLTQKK